MGCEVHPRLVERWVDIYFAKFAEGGQAGAKAWYDRAVPDNCKAKVLFLVKKRSKQT